MLQVIGRVDDVEIRHNTMIFGRSETTANAALMLEGTGSLRLTVVNNVFDGGQYGFFLSGGRMGIAAIQEFSATGVAAGNTIGVSWNPGYGTQNTVVASAETMGFAGIESGDLRLLSTSPIRNSGTRGVTPGVPSGALASALAARSQQ